MGTMREQRLYPVEIVMIMGKFDHITCTVVCSHHPCVVLYLLRCFSSPVRHEWVVLHCKY